MDFGYTEEQTLFSNSLQKLLADTYDMEARRGLIQDGPGYSEELWQVYAELGVLGILVPEQHGGFDGSSVDAMVVGLELGKALALEPVLPTVILGGGAVQLAGSDQQKADILPKIVDGSLKLAVAFAEPTSRFDLADVTTTAAAEGDGYLLNGVKNVVLGGDAADRIIVSARTSGEAGHDTDGITLFVVGADADGVSRENYRLVDSRGGADVTLENVHVSAGDVLGEVGNAYGLIEQISDRGAAFACAEALGAFARINEITLDYLKVREQFGRPIGSFQVLQHRMADMLIEYEYAKSLVFQACMNAESEDETTRIRSVSAAKVYLGENGRKSGLDAIQMHGGIGVTQEYELGDYVKRMTVAEFLFGDVDHHVARFGAVSYAA
jgi:alkylation response protein AidB-like acyl-CoA dehydrogenase